MSRTIIKWLGLLSTASLLILIAMFVLSFYRVFGLERQRVQLRLERGAFLVDDKYGRFRVLPRRFTTGPAPQPLPSWFDNIGSDWTAFTYSITDINRTRAPAWRAWPYYYRGTESVLPLWIPMMLCGVVSGFCGYRYFRRRPLNHCPCGYNLAGLPTSAPCPECGQAQHLKS